MISTPEGLQRWRHLADLKRLDESPSQPLTQPKVLSDSMPAPSEASAAAFEGFDTTTSAVLMAEFEGGATKPVAMPELR